MPLTAEKIKLVLETLNAAAATKSAKKDAENEGHGPTAEESTKAYKTAAGHAAKAHKAMTDLHEHLSGMEKDGHKGADGLAEDAKDCAKACKGLSAKCHKAAGEDMDDSAGKSALSPMESMVGDALKALTTQMTAQANTIANLEKLAYQPKSGGAGAITTARKGAGVSVDARTSAVLTEDKDPEDMTPGERSVARKAALSRAQKAAMPADQFERTSVEFRRATVEVLKLAQMDGEAIV